MHKNVSINQLIYRLRTIWLVKYLQYNFEKRTYVFCRLCCYWFLAANRLPLFFRNFILLFIFTIQYITMWKITVDKNIERTRVYIWRGRSNNTVIVFYFLVMSLLVVLILQIKRAKKEWNKTSKKWTRILLLLSYWWKNYFLFFSYMRTFFHTCAIDIQTNRGKN